MCDCARFKAGAVTAGAEVEADSGTSAVSEPQPAAPEAARDRVTSSRLAS